MIFENIPSVLYQYKKFTKKYAISLIVSQISPHKKYELLFLEQSFSKTEIAASGFRSMQVIYTFIYFQYPSGINWRELPVYFEVDVVFI
jgi:hypothetical protein